MKKRTLALFLAGAMALGLVGCGPKEADPTPTPEPLVYDEEKTADVIVVGAGGAGLAAAISAADAGAESVIVVEKLGKTGGSLNYTSGSMSGAETIIQQLDGIEDTKASYIEDILSNGDQKGDREMIETYVEEDVAAIQWLWDNGLSEYTFSEQGGKKSVFAPEHQLYSIQRTYKPRAMDRENYKSAAHEILDKVIATYDNVTIDFYTEVEALVGNEKARMNPAHRGDEEYNYFLAVAFPASHLKIIDYNRVVRDLNGMSPAEFLEKLEKNFVVEDKGEATYTPVALHNFALYLEGHWYSLTAREGTYDDNDPIGQLDVTISSDLILRDLIGITDLRSDKRIDFVGGIRGLEELRRRVDSGEMAFALALYPVSMTQLMNIADTGNIMPPKTTWFEPKLRSGLVIHSLD